ncbi:MAG TPA: alpha/beta hydrolase [Thermomicrobiaceae bacterium]|nr:alpha/beta hydrolase [Thermomicrobiaceae bacterium]
MPYVDASGVRLYYESAGEGTTLILHGHGHLAWMPFQVPYFSQFYRVIVFDRRGTGRSDDPPGPWSAADLARDIKHLMDALGIERAIVGGASLGGVVSSQFGLDFPDRSLALIVGHTVPYLWPLGRQWLEEEVAAAATGGPVIVRQPRSYDWEEAGPTTAVEGFADTLAGRYLATLRQGLGGTTDAAIKALAVLRDWDQRPRYPEMHRLAAPVLVIVGGNEPQKTIELAYEWHQQFADSDFVILPNTHHGAARENPIGWNRAVHEFLRRRGL